MTKEEHDRSFQQQDDNLLIRESTEYRIGYKNEVLDVQIQYNLRNRNIVINPNKYPIDQPSTSQPKKYFPKKNMPKVVDPKEDASKGFQERKKDVNTKEIGKIQYSFNIKNEISKIKIYVPFNDVLKNVEYRRQIIKMLKT